MTQRYIAKQPNGPTAMRPHPDAFPKRFVKSCFSGTSRNALLIALIAGLFGFGGIAPASAGIAQLVFCVFFALFVGTALARLLGPHRP